MHFTRKKKREKEANGVVLNGIISLLLPLDAQRIREKEAFVPLLFPLILSPKPENKPDRAPPTYMKPGIAHAPHDEGWIEEPCGGLRRLHRGASATLPCLQDGTEAG